MLQLKNVRKTYKDFALDCSLEVKPGQITALIGPNGAGKSTTFKAILGLIHTDGGEISLFGRTVPGAGAAERQRMGVALADSGFSGELCAKDVRTILANLYDNFEPERFDSLCRALSLPMDKKIKEFSTGMKAKLRVVSAITHRAELLILDEPTAGLDVLARDQILDLLRESMEQNDHNAILISSHLSSDLETLCDDFYMIDNGNILCHEETDRLLSEYGVLKLSEQEYAGREFPYVLRRSREPYGWRLLTDQRRFYAENYPGLVVERAGLDDFILLMIKGEKV